jgi:hypothetical protein
MKSDPVNIAFPHPLLALSFEGMLHHSDASAQRRRCHSACPGTAAAFPAAAIYGISAHKHEPHQHFATDPIEGTMPAWLLCFG